MNTEMKKTRLDHDITYNEIAQEAGLHPGAVYVVELGHPIADEDTDKVTSALKRLVASVAICLLLELVSKYGCWEVSHNITLDTFRAFVFFGLLCCGNADLSSISTQSNFSLQRAGIISSIGEEQCALSLIPISWYSTLNGRQKEERGNIWLNLRR